MGEIESELDKKFFKIINEINGEIDSLHNGNTRKMEQLIKELDELSENFPKFSKKELKKFSKKLKKTFKHNIGILNFFQKLFRLKDIDRIKFDFGM